MAYLLLVRHGETEANRLGIYQGQTCDPPLNKNGKVQAKKLSRALKNFPIETIYSSPAKRTLETAVMINRYHKKNIILEKAFLEINHGLFDGKIYEQVKAEFPEILNVWENRPEQVKFPKGETLRGAYRRAAKRARDIIREMTLNVCAGTRDENVLIVSHGGTITLILMHILGMPLSDYRKLACHLNTGVTLIKITETGPRIVTINNTAHLKN